MSSRQSGGGSGRARRPRRLSASDWIGASELFSSCPSTRIRRRQAWRSSSRSGRLTSASTRSRWGRPPWRNALVRISQRPEPPGKAASRIGEAPSRRHASSPRSAALAPSSCGSGRPSSRSPARLVSFSFPDSSNAKTATSISAMTRDSRAVASSALRRCCCSVSVSALTSKSTSPRGSCARAPRARIEKSPSRIAASRFEIVCSGRTRRSQSRGGEPEPEEDDHGRQRPAHFRREVPGQRSRSATSTAGSAASAASSRTRRSWRRGFIRVVSPESRVVSQESSPALSSRGAKRRRICPRQPEQILRCAQDDNRQARLTAFRGGGRARCATGRGPAPPG